MSIKFKVIAAALIFILFFSSFLIIRGSLDAQENVAQEGVPADKLDQVLDGQKEILKELSAIKEQLNSIQLRTNKL